MTADERPRVRGFWSLTVLFRDKLLSWDLLFAAIAAILVLLFTPDETLPNALDRLSGGALGVATALVGVVVAGLAVLVAFSDDEFLLLMDEAARPRHGGLEGQLFPFVFVSGLGVADILCALVAVTFGPDLAGGWQRALMVALTLLLVWTAFAVFNLVAFLHATGVNRGLLIRRRAQRRRQDGE